MRRVRGGHYCRIGFLHGFEGLAAGAKRCYAAVLIGLGQDTMGHVVRERRGMKKVDRAQRKLALNPAALDARFPDHVPGRVA